jgi:hypothetical protein
LKITIDENTDIILDISEDKEKVLFSSKIKDQSGKIYLTTLELDVDQADLVASKLISLMSKIMIKNV